MKYPRSIKDKILQSFKVSPVTLLIGPRQCGKTTLMKEVASELNLQYITFDTLKQLIAVQEDPEGYVRGLTNPVILDEVQRVPEIALPLKIAVDENRRPGFFGLTGSANPLAVPKLNDSLAGRMFIMHLWPFSRTEILQTKSHFIEKIFDPHAKFSEGMNWDKLNMIDVFIAGGYPNVIDYDDETRDQWYDNLITTILERDVKDLADIARPRDLAILLSILATRPSSLHNAADLARIASFAYTTLNHYLYLLESLFLVIRLPAWHKNKVKRLVKMPKLYFVDTGLLINQLKLNPRQILENGKLLGLILENFVFMELTKLISASSKSIEMYHYRAYSGIECDFILENREGNIVCIEVKASESISSEDWKGISELQEELGEKMVRGIILYSGKDVIVLGKNRIALPLTSLWNN